MRTTENVVTAVVPDEANKLYCTSDGLAFFDEQEAIDHTNELADKAIARMTEEQADAEALNVSDDNWLREMEELLNELDEEPI